MKKTVKEIVFFSLLAAVTSANYGQVKSSPSPKVSYSHGTCATAVLAPFGAAFIIDSRITENDENGAIISQFEGCKVLLARHSILLAGVGLEDTTGNAGHWNSLDEAAKALKDLPQNPTEDQLNQWGEEWGQSLWRHFREAGKIPPSAGKVSEMLLITKIGDEPYFRRTTVTWDGFRFGVSIAGQNIDKQHPYVLYSGACREFVNHASDEGTSIVPAKYRNFFEEMSMRQIGNRMRLATTVNELAIAADGLEEMLTQIDTRLEGDRAVIAPPYATAQWNEGSSGWTTHFNAKCGSSSHLVVQTPSDVPDVARPPTVTSNHEPATTIVDTPTGGPYIK